MADTPDKDQQTEAPTAKRKADAVKEGDVLASRELATALMLLAGTAWLYFAGRWLFDGSRKLLASGLRLEHAAGDSFDPLQAAWSLMGEIALPIASLFGITLVAAVLAPAILGSGGFRSNAMLPKASRINPLSGLKRMFGMHGLNELLKALAKVVALGAIGYCIVSALLREMMSLGTTDVANATSVMGQQIAWAVALLTLGLVLIAGIDVPAQWLQRNARLKMSKQQLKEEMRQSEGAPELKQAQRARQHAQLTGSARKGVMEASVILTNPTHFAVALRYRPGIDAAPVVVARGRDEMALAIRALAHEQHIPTLEYPQLTRAIYFTTRTGRIVSEELYVAVATILAFVFRLDQMLADEARQPTVDIPTTLRFDAEGRCTS